MRFQRHIFICENIRPEGHPRGCCGNKGGAEVKEKLKKRLKELGLTAKNRANSAGCLDACEFGITMVVYPEQVWYGGVTLGDIDEIVESHIINGTPVDRLKINDPRFLKELNEYPQEKV